MTNHLRIVNKILYPITILFLLIANFRLFHHRWINYFTVPEPVKDEIGFYESFVNYLNKGLYESIVSGSSIIFNLLNRVIYLFNDNILMCLRWNSFISLIAIIISWFLFIKNKIKLNFKYSLLVFLVLLHIGFRSHAYFTACNDGLFILFITLSFITLYNGFENDNIFLRNLILSGVLFAFAFSTRELAIYYIFGFILMIILFLISKKISLSKIAIWPISFLLIVLVFHFPSIREKKSLSFHNKDFNNINVTWAEMNYLSLLNNKDKLLKGRVTKGEQKISAEDVIEYKKINGANALPKTYFEAIFWDYEITIKNFFGLIYLSQLPFVPQLGLFYILFFLPVLFFLMRKKLFKIYHLLPLIYFFSYVILFCITPIRHIEFRHFMFFTFFIFIFSFIHLIKINILKCQVSVSLLYINIIFISSLSILLWSIF